MLRRWCQEAQQRGGKAFPGAGTPHDQEVARLKRDLVMQAVLMAVWQRRNPEPVLLHSDRGTQYTSQEFHLRTSTNIGLPFLMPSLYLCERVLKLVEI